MTSQKKFSFRGFTSFTLTLSFILISVSGIVLYIVPSGRVAYWINWKLVGLTRDNWDGIAYDLQLPLHHHGRFPPVLQLESARGIPRE